MNKRAVFLLTLIVLSIALLPATSYTETASPDEASLVCKNWLYQSVVRNDGWAGSDKPDIADVDDIIVNGTLLGRCYHIEPVGFVIVPVLKEMAPITVSSDENGIDMSQTGGPAQMIRDILRFRTDIYIEHYGSLENTQPDKGEVFLDRSHREQWDYYLQDENAFKTALTHEKADPADIGPLLTTRWHQDDPYNNFCPIGDGGARCVVGCGATAIAQIMKYHNWPPEGIGSYEYWWGGDGSAPGRYLSASFIDPFDWDNMPDDDYSLTLTEENALAELCYEAGVAHEMDYGVDGSSASFTRPAIFLPQFFRYKNLISTLWRSSQTAESWSDLIQSEVTNNRPAFYFIYTHFIIADGWRQSGELNQVHMNYGWGGSQNLWYTIDLLHCPWSGCTWQVEGMLINIEPNRTAEVDADVRFGHVPLEVNFTGSSSDSPIDSWTWDFGDNDSGFVQSPSHTYTASGRYDIMLRVKKGAFNYYYPAEKYITAFADTLKAVWVAGQPGDKICVDVNLANTQPLSAVKIPVNFKGDLYLTYDSVSYVGTRAELFDVKSIVSLDPYTNFRMAVSLYNTVSPDLEPGSGTIIKIYFTIPAGAEICKANPITFTGYSTHLPLYYWEEMDYEPILESSEVYTYMCGDVNRSGYINLRDILDLIYYKYLGRDDLAPSPMESGDVNGDEDVNLSDIMYLIEYIYGDPPGPAPVCP